MKKIKNKKKCKPPRLGKWLIRHLWDYQAEYSIIGDFEEVFHEICREKGCFTAWHWYWYQSITSIYKYLIYTFRGGFSMFKNYLKIAFRNLWRNKTFSFVNISGLAIGMAAFLLIFLYVSFEMSYDRFHKNVNHIYRIRNDRIYKDIHDKSVGCPPALGPTLKKEFPEVLDFARLSNMSYMGKDNIVSYDKKVTFTQDKVFFAEASFLRIFSFPMVKGSADSALEEPNTAVICKSSSIKYFGSEDPMGKTIVVTNGYGQQVYKITGICEDVPQNSHIKFELLLSYETLINLNNRAKYYWGWNAFNTYVLLSPAANPRSLQAKFPGIIEKYKNYGKPFEYFFLDESFNNQYKADRRFGKIFALFAVLAIFVSCLGLLGLASFTARQRTKEIGLRKVLGSSVPGIVYLLSREFTRWVLAANLIAWPLAYIAMNKWLNNFAYRTDFGIEIFILAGFTAFLIALVTISHQSIKAARANPVDSLKYE